MYRTLPCAQSHLLSHLQPSAIAIVNSINANDLPALDGPAISILWPCLSTSLIKHGANSGRLLQSSSRLSGSGKSSLIDSMYSTQSFQDSLPMLVAIRYCRLLPRSKPGILLKRLGFLVDVSTSNPFCLHTLNK